MNCSEYKEHDDDELAGTLKLKYPLDIDEVSSRKGSILEVDEPEIVDPEPLSFLRSSKLTNEIFDEKNLKICSGLLYDNQEDNDHSGSEEDLEPFEMFSRKMEDITTNRDGGVLKMEIEPGIGEIVTSRSRVLFHYSAYLEYSDEPFDSTFLRNRPQKSHLDSEDIIPGLRIGLLTMRPKEKSRFLIKPAYAFGEFGCPPRIPARTTIMYIVTLLGALDVSAAEDFENYSWEQKHQASFQEKHAAAKAHHKQANEHYREKRHYKAKNCYRKAAWILENMSLQNETEEKLQTDMLFKMHSNLAQVYLDLKEPARACTECRLALEVPTKMSEQEKVKVYFRFGKAKMTLNDFKSARKYFLKAQNVNPNNNEIRVELENLIRKEEIAIKREKLLCKKMIAMDKPSVTVNDTPITDSLDAISECGSSVFQEQLHHNDYSEHGSELASENEEADAGNGEAKFSTVTSDKVSSNIQSAFRRLIKNFANDPSRPEFILPPNLSSDELDFIRQLAQCISLKLVKGFTQDSKQWKLVRLS